MKRSTGFFFAVVPAVVSLTTGTSIARAQYAVFDGSHDTISVPGNTVVGTAFTMEARVRVFEGQEIGRIYAEQLGAQEDKGIYVGVQTIAGLAWTGLEYVHGITQNLSICPNQWHHVAFVRDGSEERLYLDGELVISRPWEPAIANASGSPRSIGAFQYTLGGPFEESMQGVMDYVRVSSAARYAGASFTPPLESALVSDANTLLFYKFNEAPGSLSVIDSGPLGHTGIVASGFAGATAPTFTGIFPTPADVNDDGSINGEDLAVVLGQWGPCDSKAPACSCVADFDGDGIVGGNDLAVVLGAWTG